MHSLTRVETKRLVVAISDPKHRLLVKTAFWHGLRVSEAIGLVKENVRDGYLTVQRLKGSNKTSQPLIKTDDPDLQYAEELEQYVSTLQPREALFDITRRGIAKVIEREGLKAGLPRHKLHPHALKHSIAMQSIRKAGIENVRQYLGHKSIASTGAYLRVSDEAASKEIGAAMA